MIMKKKCEHSRLITISHWWFRFKCEDCGKRFRWLPKGDWYTFGE